MRRRVQYTTNEYTNIREKAPLDSFARQEPIVDVNPGPNNLFTPRVEDPGDIIRTARLSLY